MKILVAGGGTAGHISPVLAVIASIRKLNKEAEILFVCSGKDFEIDLLKKNNISYKIIPTGKFRRYGRGKFAELIDVKTQIQNIKDLGRTVGGYNYSRKIIKQFKPDAIFLKGGHVSLPVGLAASRMNVPYVIHESDIVMGKANKLLSKKASAIAVSFPVEAYKDVNNPKMYFTGNPVRPEFYINAELKPKLKKEQKPNIMIFAGSQGAESINNVLFENIELILKNFDVLHIAGQAGVERARFVKHRLPKELKKSYEPYGFLSDEMVAAYKWADIVVSRAGMNSLSELAALSKPSIIIPLAGSTNNHQFKNANYLAKQGAVRVLLQSDLEGKRLVNEISKLASDHEAMSYLSTSIHKFFKPNSSTAIAELILSLGINRNKKEA